MSAQYFKSDVQTRIDNCKLIDYTQKVQNKIKYKKGENQNFRNKHCTSGKFHPHFIFIFTHFVLILKKLKSEFKKRAKFKGLCQFCVNSKWQNNFSMLLLNKKNHGVKCFQYTVILSSDIYFHVLYSTFFYCIPLCYFTFVMYWIVWNLEGTGEEWCDVKMYLLFLH